MRRGYTLVEVLVVMAILVFMLAIAWPSISRSMAGRQVQSAADNVRTKLSHARLGAMRSSHVYAFQYQPGSGSYRLSPQDDSAAAQGDGSARSCGDQDSSADEEDGPPPEEGTLPNGIHFLADETPDPESSADAALNLAQSDEGDGWSDPIYFYPDGTTSDARFVVANDRGITIRIRLRGVTGNVALGDTGQVAE